jgi:O-antigen/teichoic acid export membrane protein
MSEQHALARRAAAGTATNVAGQAVVILTLLVLAPVVAHAVGPTDYGVWVLIGSVASFAFLLELGISAALVKFVAEQTAKGDVVEGAKMMAAANWLYALLAAVALGIGLLAALALPEVIDLHGADARLVRPLMTLIALDVAISVLAIPPMAVLRGLQRFPTVNAINGACAVTGLVITVIVLGVGGGIVGVAAAGAGNSALTYAVSLIAVRRIAPEFPVWRRTRDQPRIGRLLRFSGSIAVIQLADRMQTRLDVIVIAVWLPVGLVTPYNFAQRLATGTLIAGDQFGRVLLPLATEVGAGRDPAALKPLFLTTVRLTLAIALGIGLPVAVLGGPILSVWVGHAYAGYGVVVAMLTVAAIIDLPSATAGYILQSIERHPPLAWMALGNGAVNLGLSIALVGPWGINGVAAGTLIATAAEMTLFVCPYAARVLGVTAGELASEALLPLGIPALVLSGLLVGGSEVLAVTSVAVLVLVIAVAIAGYCVAYLATGARAAERAAWLSVGSAALRLPARLRRPRSGSSSTS